MKINSIKLESTLRPLLGEIVEIPENISAPTIYCEQRGKEMKCRVGRIVEVLPTLVVVAFFGYSATWDYSIREANQFLLQVN